jgi:hypothetical protein
MDLVKVKSNGPYIRRCLTQTDEDKFIFIDLGTDEYNLNIFVGTNEMNDVSCFL